MSRKGGGCCCAVVGCKNTSVNSTGIHFYKFPKAAHLTVRRQKWINSVKRKNADGSDWVPTANSRICSQHFVGNVKSEHPMSPSYDPSIFPDSYHKASISDDSAVRRFKRILKRQHVSGKQEQPKNVMKRQRLSEEQLLHHTSSSQSTADNVPGNDHLVLETVSKDNGTRLNTQETQVDFLEKDDNANPEVFICTQYISAATSDAQVQACIHPVSHTSKVKIVTKISTTLDKACGTNIQFADKSVGQAAHDLNHSGLLKCPFGFHGISSITNDQEMLDIAGVSMNTFRLLFEVLSSCNGVKGAKENNLLIFLAKMKTGLTFSMLGIFFSVHRTTTSRIFYATLRVMTHACKNFVLWPSREVVQATMPQAFVQASYKDCRVIIDCTEIRVDQPTSIEHRVKFYSHYKKGFTVKVLIGCTPNGLVSFVSRCYGGRTTDAQITNSSGFLDLLEPGDMVLADKGFPEIKTVLDHSGRGIVVVMPPFLKNPFFTKEEVEETYKVASVRIHVERIMQRLRIYKILNKFTVDMLPHCDDILFMCGVLVNLQPPILQLND